MNLVELIESYTIENPDNSFKKYVEEINNEKNFNILSECNLNEEKMYELLIKLKDYKYIDEIDDLKCGSFIRWIHLIDESNVDLNKYGIICDINFTDSGTIIRCKNFANRYYTLKMEECLIFQKFSKDEKIIIKMMDQVK